MAVERFAYTPNQGITTLDGALSDSATTIPVSSMADLKLTGLTGTDFAYCKITKQENWRQHPINRKETFEIAKVTAVSGNDLTAIRGVDGTSGTTFASGDIVEVVFVSIHYQHLVNALTDGTKELNIGALTVAVGDVKITNGNLGVGKTPLTDVHVAMKAASTLTTLDGSLFLEASDNAGTGNFGAGIIFGQPNGGTVANRGASIVVVEGGNSTSVGLDFYVHTTASGDPRVRALRLDPDKNAIFSGDTYWVGAGTGLDFAEISIEENAGETTIGTAGVKVQVAVFDTNGPSNSAVPDHTNNHITITRAGHYFVIASTVINSIAGPGSLAHMTCQKNNGAAQIVPHKDREIAGGGGEAKPVTISGIADLAVDDTIEIWIENETNTQNYIVEDCSLSLFMIGGT